MHFFVKYAVPIAVTALGLAVSCAAPGDGVDSEDNADYWAQGDWPAQGGTNVVDPALDARWDYSPWLTNDNPDWDGDQMNVPTVPYVMDMGNHNTILGTLMKTVNYGEYILFMTWRGYSVLLPGQGELATRPVSAIYASEPQGFQSTNVDSTAFVESSLSQQLPLDLPVSYLYMEDYLGYGYTLTNLSVESDGTVIPATYDVYLDYGMIYGMGADDTPDWVPVSKILTGYRLLHTSRTLSGLPSQLVGPFEVVVPQDSEDAVQ